jgi:hypothetical protein
MESILKRKFTAVFALGYFLSFLCQQLDDDQTDINEFSNFMLMDFRDKY